MNDPQIDWLTAIATIIVLAFLIYKIVYVLLGLI